MLAIILTILLSFMSSYTVLSRCIDSTGTFPILSWFIIIPFLSSLLVLVFEEKFSKWITLIFASIELSVAIVIFQAYDRLKGGFQFVQDIPWLKNFGIHYLLGVDGISVMMVILTSCVYFSGALVSWSIQNRIKEYFVLFSLLVAGVAGAYVSLDLFFFFLFYEFAVLPMYLLVGIWGSGKKEYAAMKLTLLLLFGSAFMLVGFLAMYFGSHVHSFDIRVLSQISQTAFSPKFQNIWFPILFLGFGVISAIFPFHTWSPDGYGSAPTAASMLHAGVLKTLGGYSILRVAVACMPEGAKHWLPWLAILTVINMIYASLAAMKQTDLKYVAAYSSVAHCGYVLFGICTLQIYGLDGAVIQMFSHGIVAALTFASIGVIYGRAHTRELNKLGGLAAVLPIIGGIFLAGSMANLGLPGLSGFVGEFLIFLGAFKSGFHGGFSIFEILAPLGLLAIILTAIYVLRIVQIVLFGPVKDDHFHEIKDGSFVEILPLMFLLIVSLIIGVYPKPFIDLVNGPVSTLISHVGGIN
jgi:NADH-quinone oxidoreductase subunit M